MELRSTPLLKSKMFWVGILYFAEGFPLGVFYDIFPVHFRQQGVELWEIGFMSLLGLAWTLKFLWAPAIDHYRHHRRWMAVADLGMGAVLLLFAIHAEFAPWVWVAIGAFTLLSATNDVAIDGYTIEMLERREMGLGNGLRIGFYRVGMLAAGFALVLSDVIGWSATYAAAAVLLAGLALASLRAPQERIVPRAQVPLGTELRRIAGSPAGTAAASGLLLGALWLADRQVHFTEALAGFWWYASGLAFAAIAVTLWRHTGRPTARDEARELTEGPMLGAMMEMLRRPGMGAVVLFILTFKLGDAAMGFMVKPFWVDAGFTASEIGLVSVNLGLALSVAGGVAGGWVTDRIGIFRALWVLGLFQALSNLGYVAAAWFILETEGLRPQDYLLMYTASGLESFTGGLGTAAFLAFLMAIVDRRHSATEYALLSSIFALSRSLAGWASGFGAASMGYAPYFLLTFFLAFPAYLLLPWVRSMLGTPNAAGERERELAVSGNTP